MTSTTDRQALYNTALRELPFRPTKEQDSLLRLLAEFTTRRSPRDAFIVNGYAGTGKTSVIAAFVRALKNLGNGVVMLSPTGRAAKVASDFSGLKASTLHKRLFRPTSANPLDSQYFIAPNRDRDTLFFIDEASMITHGENGRPSLLASLARHVYSSPGCAMILIGDTAQLPPPGEAESPAMNPGILKSLGINAFIFTLTKTMRQTHGSGILANASLIRRAIERPQNGMPQLLYKGLDDVRLTCNAELADELSSSWATVGPEETLLITRSNWRANAANRDIRARVLYADEALARGERLVIAKNDYFWGKENKSRHIIANGETAIVEWVGTPESRYGFTFADAELRLPSDGVLIACKLNLDSLSAEGPSLPRQELHRLYAAIAAEPGIEMEPDGYGPIPDKDSLSAAAATDRRLFRSPYFNAIQAKYAYCVTCHKAQGGQWRHVYVDLTGIQADAYTNPEFYRWLYTAVTRATDRLYFILPALPE